MYDSKPAFTPTVYCYCYCFFYLLDQAADGFQTERLVSVFDGLLEGDFSGSACAEVHRQTRISSMLREGGIRNHGSLVGCFMM